MAKRKAGVIDRASELVSLGRSSYASKSAIAKLLAHIDSAGLPDTFPRSSQYRARKEICRKREGEYGPLVIDTQVPLDGGGSQKFSIQNVFAFLQHNCMHSEHYAKIMQTALSRYPCSPSSPWRLILYQDGVDPSDGLAKNHSRKSAVYYWSFVEFGMQALAKEQVWGVVTVARYSEYTKLAGKGASLFEAVLDHFFGEVHHLRRTGCSLNFPNGERALLVAEPSVLLCDMPAIAECLHCKGHAGTICCPGCANATQENTAAEKALHELTDKAVSLSNTDWNAFVKHTDKSIRHVVRKLNDHHQSCLDGRHSKDKFRDYEQILGWNWSPSNIILNQRFGLRIASMLMFDGAHVYVHDGLGDSELGQMMKVFLVTDRLRASGNLVSMWIPSIFLKVQLRSRTCSVQVRTKTTRRRAASAAQGLSFLLWRLCLVGICGMSPFLEGNSWITSTRCFLYLMLWQCFRLSELVRSTLTNWKRQSFNTCSFINCVMGPRRSGQNITTRYISLIC